VLDGIRPGQRCHLRFGLPRTAATIPHPAVTGNKRRVLALPSSPLPRPSVPVPRVVLGLPGIHDGSRCTAARIILR
jgi:hypothetical protein